MLNERVKAAQMVADRLFPAERAIDAALRESMGLSLAILDAQDEANLAAELGHAAFEEVTATIQSLTHARRAVIGAHQALAQTRDKIGLREMGFGSYVRKAEDFNQIHAKTPLRTVA